MSTCPKSIYQRHIWSTATPVAGKNWFFASTSPSLLEKNCFCNTGSKLTKCVINILSFCQLSILMQK
jgi:hypothetical protein